MLKEKNRLEAKIAEIDEEIRKLPPGKFICCHGKNCTKWYWSDGHKKRYIKKEEQYLAGKLLYKKYLTFLLEELTNEKQAVESYLDLHVEEIPKSSQLMAESPEFQKLLEPFHKPMNKELEEWMNAPYEKNPYRPQDLIIKTPSGEYVRSKSEAFIYACLMKYHIPFRYECKLIAGNKALSMELVEKIIQYYFCD